MSSELVSRLILHSRWKTITKFSREFQIAHSSLYKYTRGETSDLCTTTRAKLAIAFPSFKKTFAFDARIIRPFDTIISDVKKALAEAKSEQPETSPAMRATLLSKSQRKT